MRNWNPLDIVDEVQAAQIWLGLDPATPPPFDPETEPTKSVLVLTQLFKNAVSAGQLKCCRKEVTGENVVETTIGPKIIKTVSHYFSLQDLANFATERGETPEFVEALQRPKRPIYTEGENKPFSTTEKTTLLVVIAAMCKHAEIDYSERGSAQRIREMTEELGASVTDDTIRKILAKIPDAMERRMK